MILLCGIPTESPLALVREALDELAAPYVFVNQRKFAIMQMVLEISAGQTSGRLQVNGDSYPLAEFTGIFPRLMDHRFLPELKGQPETSPQRLRCRNLFDTLTRWAEVSPARVVNRIAQRNVGAESGPFVLWSVGSNDVRSNEVENGTGLIGFSLCKVRGFLLRSLGQFGAMFGFRGRDCQPGGYTKPCEKR